MIKSNRMEVQSPEIINREVIVQPSGKDKLYGAIADNFDSILELAISIADIEKMKVQSSAVLAQMREARESLLAEAEAYAKRKDADTRSVVGRMEVIRFMMNDFYLNSGNSNLTSEDFSKIISEIVNQMGRIENE